MSSFLKTLLIISFLFELISTHQDVFYGTISNGNIKYHALKRKSYANSEDMVISSNLISVEDNSSAPVLLVSTSPLPNKDKRSHWLCGKIGGNQCVIPHDFIQNSQIIYMGVYCKSCQYTLNVQFNEQNLNNQEINQQNQMRKLNNLPELRLLQVAQAGTRGLAQTPDEKFNKLKGMSVSGMAYLIIFIICCIIGCYIMMNIFVNPKLIKTPLKLGRIES